MEPKGDADADERVKLSNTVSNEQQQHQKLHQQHSAPHQRHDSDSNINSIVLTCPYCAKESFSSLEALSLHIQALHGQSYSNNSHQYMYRLVICMTMLTAIRKTLH